MPRGRKKKIQDPVVEKAVEEINKIIDSGEKDLLENPIYNAQYIWTQKYLVVCKQLV